MKLNKDSFKFSLSFKIIALVFILTICSVITTGITIGYFANKYGYAAVNEGIIGNLEAINEAKKIQVQDYFKNLEQQMIVLSRNQTITEAMKKLEVDTKDLVMIT